MVCVSECKLHPQYIQVLLIPDVMMMFNNTTEPAAHIEVTSAVGVLGPTANQRISGVLNELLKKELGIEPSR